MRPQYPWPPPPPLRPAEPDDRSDLIARIDWQLYSAEYSRWRLGFERWDRKRRARAHLRRALVTAAVFVAAMAVALLIEV